MNNRERMQFICDEVVRRGLLRLPNGGHIYTALYGLDFMLDPEERIAAYRLKRGEHSSMVHNYLDAPFWVYDDYVFDTFPLQWPTELSKIPMDVIEAMSGRYPHRRGNWSFLQELVDHITELNEKEADGWINPWRRHSAALFQESGYGMRIKLNRSNT